MKRSAPRMLRGKKTVHAVFSFFFAGVGVKQGQTIFSAFIGHASVFYPRMVSLLPWCAGRFVKFQVMVLVFLFLVNFSSQDYYLIHLFHHSSLEGSRGYQGMHGVVRSPERRADVLDQARQPGRRRRGLHTEAQDAEMSSIRRSNQGDGGVDCTPKRRAPICHRSKRDNQGEDGVNCTQKRMALRCPRSGATTRARTAWTELLDPA